MYRIFHRTQSSASSTRLKLGVQATSDEPFFELGPLNEGYTYAFRARARDNVGYREYSMVWVVEVV